jgi:tetratricopeptide (TPR) repeat protein
VTRKKNKRASTKRPSPPPRRVVPAVALIVLGLAALFVWHCVEFRFTQDDAYISLRYAKNLVDGHGLVFNPGERVEGYSNFSWTLLLAFLLRMDVSAVLASQILGVLCGVATILVTARFARTLEGRAGPVAIATALLVAGNSAFAYWSVGGLETALFTLLVIAGLERGLAPDVSDRGRRWAPALFAGAALTRPEGPLVFALWFAIRLLDAAREGMGAARANARRLAIDVAIFGLPLLPYFAWKLWYYGDLLPNTYYAKAGLSAQFLSRGLLYLREIFEAYGLFGVSLALVALGVWPLRTRRVEIRLLAFALAYSTYVVVIGGDVLRVHRFWLPLLPIAAILIARGLETLVALAWRGRPAHHGALVVGMAALLVGGGLARNWALIQDHRTREADFVDTMRRNGVWLKQRFPAETTFATTTIGAIGYWSGLRVIDLLGLTDPEIARHPQPVPGLTDVWRETKYNAESVLRRRPDLIFFSTGIRPSAAAEKALFLYTDFSRSYYDYYYRAVPNQPRDQVVYRLRPDAPAFQNERFPIDRFEFLDRYTEALIVMGREEDSEKASELMRAAWDLSNHRFPWARTWLGATLYYARDDPEAMPLLQESLAANPYSTTALRALSFKAFSDRRIDDADAYLRRLTEVDPDDASAWYQLAGVAFQRQDFDAAYTYAKNSVNLCAVDAPSLTFLGSLAAYRGEFELARRCYERVLSLEPGNERAIRGLEELRRAASETSKNP